jgi:hypothetical protein
MSSSENGYDDNLTSTSSSEPDIITILPNEYIINKKYKSLVIDILSYSNLPLYFISCKFILHLLRFGKLLIELNLHSTENNYFETLQTLFFVKDPITKEVISINSSNYSNKILDVLFELVELLKIPSETQNMLLSLVPNNCEILFKILFHLDVIDYLDINFLFNNYNYLLRNNIELIQNKFLLSNDITEEINKQLIKQVLKEDIRTLLFIPDDKLSFDIIKYTVQNNGLALKYIKTIFFCFSKKYKYSKKIITNIIKCAVQNNGLALQFVDTEYLTDKIIELAVQNNGLSLQFVDTEYLTDKIIELAVQNNGLALQYARREDEDYNTIYILTYELCMIAVQKEGRSLEFVPYRIRTEDICMIAVQNNALALEHIPPHRKTNEICMIAVQSNYRTLKYIENDIMTDEIIDLAFQNKINNLQK